MEEINQNETTEEQIIKIYKCKKCSNTKRNTVVDFIGKGGKIYKTCNFCRSKKKQKCEHDKYKQYCEECKGGSLCYKGEEIIIKKSQCRKCRNKEH